MMEISAEMHIAFGSAPDSERRFLDAMKKPAPRQALALLASGRVKVMLGRDLDVYLDELDGRKIRDRGHMMAIAGAWPLYQAGMIDERCNITKAGRAILDDGSDA